MKRKLAVLALASMTALGATIGFTGTASADECDGGMASGFLQVRDHAPDPTIWLQLAAFYKSRC